MHLPVKAKAEAAVVPVVKAEVNQVETDQALDLRAEAVAEALLKRGVHQLQEELSRKLSRELIKGV